MTEVASVRVWASTASFESVGNFDFATFTHVLARVDMASEGVFAEFTAEPGLTGAFHLKVL